MEEIALTPAKSPSRTVMMNSPYRKDIESGNMAYEQGRYQDAIDEWSTSINFTTNNDGGNKDLLKLLYSNRSAAYSKLEQYSSALIDANKCVELDPHWLKGIVRKGDVLVTLSRYSEAQQTYQQGVNLAPLNEVVFEKCVQARKSKERMERLMQTPGGTKLVQPGVQYKPLTLSEKFQFVFRCFMLVLVIIYVSPTGPILQEFCYQSFLLVAIASFGITLHKKYGEPDSSVPVREVPRYEAWQRVMKDGYFILLAYCFLLLYTNNKHIWWLVPTLLVECSGLRFNLLRVQPHIEDMLRSNNILSNVFLFYETVKLKLMNRQDDVTHRTDALSEDDDESSLYIDESDIPENKSWFREITTTALGRKSPSGNDTNEPNGSSNHIDPPQIWSNIVSFFNTSSSSSVLTAQEADIENALPSEDVPLLGKDGDTSGKPPLLPSQSETSRGPSAPYSDTPDRYLAARVSPLLNPESPSVDSVSSNDENWFHFSRTPEQNVDVQNDEKRKAEEARQLEVEREKRLKEEEKRMRIAEEEYEREMERQEAEAAAYMEAKKAAAEQEAARLKAEKEAELARLRKEREDADAKAAEENARLRAELEITEKKAAEEAAEKELAEEVMRRERAALEAALRDEEEYNKKIEEEKLKKIEIANATVRAAEAIMYANADEAEVNRLNNLPVAEKLQLIAQEEEERMSREELSKKLDEEALDELKAIQNKIASIDESDTVKDVIKADRSLDGDDGDTAHQQLTMVEKQLVEDEKEIVGSTAARLLEIQREASSDDDKDQALEAKIQNLMKEAETQLLAHIQAKQKSREKKSSKKPIQNEASLSSPEKEKLAKQRQKAEKSRQKFDTLALRKFEADVRREAGLRKGKQDTVAAEKLKQAEEEFEVALMEAEQADRDRHNEEDRLKKDKEAWKEQLLKDVDGDKLVIKTPEKKLTTPNGKNFTNKDVEQTSQKSPGGKFEEELDRLAEEEKHRRALQVRLEFEMLKSMNRKKFDHAMKLIHSMIAGVVHRRRVRKILATLPHIVIVKLMSAEEIGIQDEANALTFGGVPDIFVSIVGHTYWGECYSRQQSAVVSGDQLVWNEKHLVSLVGENGYIVLNVMSRAALTGDSFVGQAVVDLSQLMEDFEQQMPGEEFTLDLPLSGRLSFNLHNIIGEECESQPAQREDKGYVKIRLSMASPFSNMCGWFYEVSTSIFGVIDRQKIWVVLHRNNANKWFVLSYDSKFSGDAGLKRTIDVDMIISVEKKMPASGMENGALEMVIGSSNEIITWAFGEGTKDVKGMWVRCLSRTNQDDYAPVTPSVDGDTIKNIETPGAIM